MAIKWFDLCLNEKIKGIKTLKHYRQFLVTMFRSLTSIHKSQPKKRTKMKSRVQKFANWTYSPAAVNFSPILIVKDAFFSNVSFLAIVSEERIKQRRTKKKERDGHLSSERVKFVIV